MAKSPFLSAPRPDWKVVAQEVSKRLGKIYSGQYVREVASGWRRHNSIGPILQELGVMEKPETVKPTRKNARPAVAA